MLCNELIGKMIIIPNKVDKFEMILRVRRRNGPTENDN